MSRNQLSTLNSQRQDELLADWELAKEGQEPYRIEPLK